MGFTTLSVISVPGAFTFVLNYVDLHAVITTLALLKSVRFVDTITNLCHGSHSSVITWQLKYYKPGTHKKS